MSIFPIRAPERGPNHDLEGDRVKWISLTTRPRGVGGPPHHLREPGIAADLLCHRAGRFGIANPCFAEICH